ncbi:MAG: nicotinate-nucleotide diphosphorylase (carboxylating), partial [Clostridia bacterium]|nr:nicotinate-nucleotide diphosphorylase (carboxylating) [Clostridia bacterium]
MQYFFDLDRVIDAALTEDIGTGDITTLTTIPADKQAHGRYIAKEDGVLCGVEIAEQVYRRIDRDVKMTYHFRDGDRIKKGDIIAEVEGNAVALLTGERVGLNLMQR